MKKLSVVLMFTLLAAGTLSAQSGISPQHPQPGEQVTLTFDATDSPLLGQDGVELVVMDYTLEGWTYAYSSLRRQNGKWIGQFSSRKGTLAVSYALKSGDAYDNNSGEGYFIPMHNDKGNPLPHSHAAIAVLYRDLGRNMELDRKPEVAMSYFEKSLALDPKAESLFFSTYLNLIMATQKGDEGANKALALINRIANDPASSEENLTTAMNVLRRMGKTEQYEDVKARVMGQYANGSYALAERRKEISREKDLPKREELIALYRNNYPPGNDQEKMELERMWNQLAAEYAAEASYDRMANIMKLLSAESKASLLNNLAWEMAEKGNNLDKALEFAKTAADISRDEWEKPSQQRPFYLTETDWQMSRKYNYANNLDTYAFVLDKSGNTAEAANRQLEAVQLNEGENSEMNERCTALMERAESKDLIPTLERFISNSQATQTMKEQFVNAYAQGRSESAAHDRLAELEARGKAAAKARLAKKMINRDAADFSVSNLQGENVSLESLKGKVVVLDFWATWCGPCKASFPGMQQAVDKFKSRNDVAFLFVNCWERAEDKNKNAADFIQEQGYTFNVLMDTEDKIVANYAVSGIPTKFILDKNGKIRFKSVGYVGSPEALVEELELMIELAGE